LVDPGPVRDQTKVLMRGRYRKRYWDDYRSTGGENELQQLVERKFSAPPAKTQRHLTLPKRVWR